MKANQFKVESFVKEIQKEVVRNERENLAAACQLARKEIKETLNNRQKSAPGSPPGKLSGRLQKSISYTVEKDKDIFGGIADLTGIVGSTDFRANILEFGSEKMAARPFEGPTLERITPEIKAMMSKPLVKE